LWDGERHKGDEKENMMKGSKGKRMATYLKAKFTLALDPVLERSSVHSRAIRGAKAQQTPTPGFVHREV